MTVFPFSPQWIVYQAAKTSPDQQRLSERDVVIEAGGQKYILHTIENENELFMIQETARIGLGPLVYGIAPEQQLVLIEHIDAPPLTPSLAGRHLTDIGASLRRVQATPPLPQKGAGLEEENTARINYIRSEAAKAKTPLSESLLRTAERAKKVFDEAIRLFPQTQVNSHTDLHPRNLFWTPRGLLIIDWQSASRGHPLWDLASLAIFFTENAAQEQELLKGYFGRSLTKQELREYLLVKKTRWAYTAIVNAMRSFRLLAKQTTDAVPPPNKTLIEYMQSFATSAEEPPLEFFVNVTRHSLIQTEKP